MFDWLPITENALLGVAADPSAWMRLFGRFHPIAVHFPIALLLVAAVCELGASIRRRDPASPGATAHVCLVFGVLGCLAAASTGWTLAGAESSDGVPGVELHRWLAVSASVLSGAALILAWISFRQPQVLRWYRGALLASAGVVGVAGHFGGSLVHGPDYLLEVFRPAPTEGQATARAQFAAQVPNVVRDQCFHCHGPDRQKGGLRLDTAEGLFQSGGRGPIVVLGRPEASELVRRVELPPDDGEFMPRGEDPLTPDQIDVIRAWILGEASTRAPSGSQTPEAARPAPASQLVVDEAARDAALTRLREMGVFAVRESETTAGVQVRFDLRDRAVTDEDLAALAGLELALVDLSLRATSITDDGVGRLSAFEALERLDLSETAVTGGGVAGLVGLERLRFLNLHSTAVDDMAIEMLAALPALERVVLWNTSVSAAGVTALRERRPDVDVVGADG